MLDPLTVYLQPELIVKSQKAHRKLCVKYMDITKKGYVQIGALATIEYEVCLSDKSPDSADIKIIYSFSVSIHKYTMVERATSAYISLED